MERHWTESLYVSVSRVQRHVARMAEEAFSGSGVAPSHAVLLLLLEEWKELSPMEIASSIDVSPSTATRLLDKLERLKLIKRRYEGVHAYVTLSKTGQQKIPEIQGRFEDMELALNRIVTSRNRDRAVSLLRDLVERFTRKRRA